MRIYEVQPIEQRDRVWFAFGKELLISLKSTYYQSCVCVCLGKQDWRFWLFLATNLEAKNLGPTQKSSSLPAQGSKQSSQFLTRYTNCTHCHGTLFNVNLVKE